MKEKPEAERQFNRAAERDKGERERLIRQLSPPDQLRVNQMRQEHERDVLDRRQFQEMSRTDEIQREFAMLVREHARPEPRPLPLRPLQRSGAELERMAAKAVDEQNRQEIVQMGASLDKAIDHFLEIRGQTYEQFKGEREDLREQRELTRENNDATREI